MKKQIYQEPKLDVVLIERTDVITTSSPYGEEGSWGDWTPEDN